MAERGSARVKVGRQGRLVIPARFRRALGIEVDDELVVRAEEGRLVLERQGAGLERARGLVRPLPPGTSAVDELLAERRADAEREPGRTRKSRPR